MVYNVHQNNCAMIPKKIHYIWIGNKEIPEELQKYINSWNILSDNGWEIKQWNNSNLDLDNLPDSIKAALKYKKYAFVSDYLRLKILYDEGGVYFDSDVEVYKDFSNLLSTGILLGYIYKCSIGTAVIGAEKQHPLIKELIEYYNWSEYTYNSRTGEFVLKYKEFENYKLINNNDLFTALFLKKYKEFNLNGKEQKFQDIHIYPIEYFEGYSLIKKNNYTIHHTFGSWRSQKNGKRKIKLVLEKCYILYALIDKMRRIKMNPKLPFSDVYYRRKRARNKK